jgi:hypothetical protein
MTIRPATLLDPVEEPFDPVAGTIETRAEANRVLAITFGGMLADPPFLMASSLIQSASQPRVGEQL